MAAPQTLAWWRSGSPWSLRSRCRRVKTLPLSWKPVACDATARSDLDAAAGSGAYTGEEDGPVLHPCEVVVVNCDDGSVGDGARRAGPPQGQRHVSGQRRACLGAKPTSQGSGERVVSNW
jgi:hypothetical protein